MADVVSIGECMVELARGDDERFRLAYGGDTFNTAVYLARSGVPTRYATALGDDRYSRGILDLAAAEGVGTDLVAAMPGRMPGLYLIETTPGGERTFYYWRDRSPARELFDGATGDAVLEAMRRADLVYLSGITLSLYPPAALERLADGLADAKRVGARVAIDSNYRPRGWAGDRGRARNVIGRFMAIADVALPTFDDEQALWGDATPDDTVARYRELGVPETVVKLGPDGVITCVGGSAQRVPTPGRVKPVDTTGAGDSFNAGYLAARVTGAAPEAAALAGHRLAGIVVMHRGAIVPREATGGVRQNIDR